MNLEKPPKFNYPEYALLIIDDAPANAVFYIQVSVRPTWCSNC